MATTFHKTANNAYSTLTADVSSGSTSFTIQSGEGSRFPSTFPFYSSIDSEIISFSDRSGDTLYCSGATGVRGDQNTSAAGHLTGSTIELLYTSGQISEIQTAVNTAETSISTLQAGNYKTWTSLDSTNSTFSLFATPATINAFTNTSTINFGGDLNLASGKVFKINNSQISTSNLSDSTNLPYLNTRNTFSNGMNLNKTLTISNGATLVNNGTFDTTTTGWNAWACTLSIASNQLKIQGSNTGSGVYAYQVITGLTIGKRYKYSITLASSNAAGNYIFVGSASSGPANPGYGDYLWITSATVGTYSATFTATATTCNITFGHNDTNATYHTEWDNVSLVEMGDVSISGNIYTDQTNVSLFNSNALTLNIGNSSCSSILSGKLGINKTPIYTLDIAGPVSINNGGELVTNGTFTTNTTGWLNYAVTEAIDTNRLKITQATSSNCFMYQQIAVTAGKRYKFSGTVTTGTGSGFLSISNGSNVFDQAIYNSSANPGTISTIFTVPVGQTSIYVLLYHAGGINTYNYVDDVSLVEMGDLTSSGDLFGTNASLTGSLTSVGLTSTGVIAVNSATGITTNQTTFPLLNTTATTVNAFGAATAINMGAAAATFNLSAAQVTQSYNGAYGTYFSVKNTSTGGIEWSLMAGGASSGAGLGLSLLEGGSGGSVRATFAPGGGLTVGGNLTLSKGSSNATINLYDSAAGLGQIYHQSGVTNFTNGSGYVFRISGTAVATINGSGHIYGNEFRLNALNTAPSSASDTGTLGEIRWDANYMYVCTASNTWKRSAISTW